MATHAKQPAWVSSLDHASKRTWGGVFGFFEKIARPIVKSYPVQFIQSDKGNLPLEGKTSAAAKSIGQATTRHQWAYRIAKTGVLSLGVAVVSVGAIAVGLVGLLGAIGLLVAAMVTAGVSAGAVAAPTLAYRVPRAGIAVGKGIGNVAHTIIHFNEIRAAKRAATTEAPVAEAPVTEAPVVEAPAPEARRMALTMRPVARGIERSIEL